MERIEKLMKLDAIISFKTRIDNEESDALNSHDDKMVKETRCYRSDAIMKIVWTTQK